MACERKTKLTILSEIDNLTEGGASVDDVERTEITAQGTSLVRDGALLISYSTEENGERTDTEITVTEDTVTVRREGAAEHEFVFREGFTHRTVYRVGAYAFDAEVRAKRIRNNIALEGGRLDLFYSMVIGGAEKRVRMKIISE